MITFRTTSLSVWRSFCGTLALLFCCLTFSAAVMPFVAAADEVPVLPSEGLRWVPQPTWLENAAVLADVSQETVGEVIRFAVGHGGTGMKWQCSFPARNLPDRYPYLAFRYRAVNAASDGGYAITMFSGGGGDTTLFDAEKLVSDGHWRTVSIPTKSIAQRLQGFRGLAVQLQAEASNAILEIADLRLTETAAPVTLETLLPFSVAPNRNGASDTASYTMLSLPKVEPSERNFSINQWLEILGVETWFPSSGVVEISEVPFQMIDQRTLPGTPLNEKGSLFFEVDHVSASEIYIVLLAELQGRDWDIFGGGTFKSLRDVDRFRFRIYYEDGEIDETFPCNIKNVRYVVAQGIQAVAIPADSSRVIKRLEMFELTNQGMFAIAAVSFRKNATPRFMGTAPVDTSLLHVDATLPEAGTSGLIVRLEANTPPVLKELKDRATGWQFISDVSATPATPLICLTVDGLEIPLKNFHPINQDAKNRRAWSCSIDERTLEVGLQLRYRSEEQGSEFIVDIKNTGSQSVRLDGLKFQIGPYRLSDIPENAWYIFPASSATCSNRSGKYLRRYSGYFPVQFVESFAPKERRGLTLRTEDVQCLNKSFGLVKERDEMSLLVDFHPGELPPQEVFTTSPIILNITDGSPARGLEIYRNWVRSWHRPAQPRQQWFREAFNFRQCFLHAIDPLMDRETGRIDLLRSVEETKREFGGIDFFHLFDWGNCGPHERIYGRVGDYSPWDFLQGGLKSLRQELDKLHERAIPTGFYLEGYLLGGASQLQQRARDENWKLIGKDGKPSVWPGSSESYICPMSPQWLKIMEETYAEKTLELDASGMYLDQFGFAGEVRDCYSTEHGHHVPGHAPLLEKNMTASIRKAISDVKPNVVLYTEEVPIDLTTQYQDGSFSYALTRYKNDPGLVPLNIARFAFPDFKIFHILLCDQPVGPWAAGVRLIFFNGDGIWLEGPATGWFTEETRAEIRRCYAVLHEHRDAFTTDSPQCLIPTEQVGVHANSFHASGSKTVVTLFNSCHHTVRGEVFKFAHSNRNLVYVDAFTKADIKARRTAQFDFLEYTLPPMGCGCIVIREQ